ncbi:MULTISPECIES: universal stress protein [Cyanophyceae]|uniref:Universal stress protein n=1 Tax=Leptolyngbya subtilissima DQ-A4 TaxID=2933933 RepID=A0ABV0K5Z5_9CYAN|nr:universal stress protein [Nodosilinea sp. FACHB-141]MBD2114541.1 universal stress protein [Nodosilinea sp. FACHB-141]
MKRLLLCTDGSTYAQSSYRYGAWFAKQGGASIDVLYVSDSRDEVIAETTDLSGSIGLGTSESLLKKLVEVEHEQAKRNHQQAKLILADAQQAIANHGVKSIQLLHKTGFLIDHLETLEANADLIVIGKQGESANSTLEHLGTNADRIVRSSTKPCLVTPQEFVPIERLLVAYDGSSTGKSMLTFLANIPGLHHLEIHLLMAARAESDITTTECIAEAVSLLHQAGIKPVITILPEEPEKSISQYAREQDISLLLIGAYSHRSILHTAIDSTTIQLLRSSQIPVLLFR